MGSEKSNEKLSCSQVKWQSCCCCIWTFSLLVVRVGWVFCWNGGKTQGESRGGAKKKTLEARKDGRKFLGVEFWVWVSHLYHSGCRKASFPRKFLGVFSGRGFFLRLWGIGKLWRANTCVKWAAILKGVWLDGWLVGHRAEASLC